MKEVWNLINNFRSSKSSQLSCSYRFETLHSKLLSSFAIIRKALLLLNWQINYQKINERTSVQKSVRLVPLEDSIKSKQTINFYFHDFAFTRLPHIYQDRRVTTWQFRNIYENLGSLIGGNSSTYMLVDYIDLSKRMEGRNCRWTGWETKRDSCQYKYGNNLA